MCRTLYSVHTHDSIHPMKSCRLIADGYASKVGSPQLELTPGALRIHS